MPSILITAFEPYDTWTENSSWLALVEYSKELPTDVRVVTRRYPVNFQAVRERLARDLSENFDYALHLGQAPGSTAIRLEAFGINVGGSSQDPPEVFKPLVADGPAAYRSSLPISTWAQRLRDAGIPAIVSYHAGTYLCNATLYLSQHLAYQQQLRTQTTFIHLPLDTSQVCRGGKETASLPVTMAAAGIRLIVTDLTMRGRSDAASLA